MKKLTIFLFVAAVTLVPAQELKRGHDVAHVTDVSVPQPEYQVLSPAQIESIYTQKQALDDIKDRLTSIDGSIKDMKLDISKLMETDIIVNFLLGVTKFLIPGLIITAFGIWLTEWFKKRKPNRAKA